LTVFVNKHNSVHDIKKNEMALHVAHMEYRTFAYRVSIAKPEGKTTHVRPGHIWEDNIKMDFREVG